MENILSDMENKYKYYSCPDIPKVLYRAIPKDRIADELWEVYVGHGEWLKVDGVSAECESGLMYGCWNDLVVVEVSANNAKSLIKKYWG